MQTKELLSRQSRWGTLGPMPELPEVETVRRLLDRTLVGQTLAEVELADDNLVFESPTDLICTALKGSTVSAAGRKGKHFWLELGNGACIYAHLGMSGWVRELDAPEVRLLNHGNAPLDEPDGSPRFLKLLLKTDSGRRVVLTDGRRLARIGLGEMPSTNKRMAKLGPDCLTDLPSVDALIESLGRKKAPIKVVLMDQAFLSGIGNWVADEVLYQSRIAPMRPAQSLDPKEVSALRGAISFVLQHSVEVGADAERYPADWMFHHRWGGSKGSEMIAGMEIKRESVGGRTTAWVPGLQR